MQHWRKQNIQKSLNQKQQELPGVKLDLQQMMDCKRLAQTLHKQQNSKVKTHLVGGFHSRFRGRGMDFDEARLYQPGDDIRNIDWRVTARTGKTYTKIFKEEKERPVFLLLDQSSSMFFGSKNYFKSVLASHIAATLMWSALEYGNRVGGLFFDPYEHIEIKPSMNRRNCMRLLNLMVEKHNAQVERIFKPYIHSKQAQKAGPSYTNLGEAIARLRYLAKPGSLIYLISDFHQFDKRCEQHLAPLAQHNDIRAIAIYDPLEKELPAPNSYCITDGTNIDTINTNNHKMRKRYQQEFEQRIAYLEQFFLLPQTNFSYLSTAEQLTEGLQQLRTDNSIPLQVQSWS